jgi:hypothetical protein
MSFQKKYLKYKQKYLDLKYKNQKGGASYGASYGGDKDLELAIKESLNPRYGGIPLECKQEAASTNGFRYIDIDKDGNCLYHCIARHMNKTHIQVRQEITDYIDRNRAQFTRISGIIEEEGGIDEYLTKQRRLTVYGDYIIIFAAAALYNIHISVYRLIHDQINNSCSFIPIDEYAIKNNIVADREITDPSRPVLYLSYESNNHYGYLELKDRVPLPAPRLDKLQVLESRLKELNKLLEANKKEKIAAFSVDPSVFSKEKADKLTIKGNKIKLEIDHLKQLIETEKI